MPYKEIQEISNYYYKQGYNNYLKTEDIKEDLFFLGKLNIFNKFYTKIDVEFINNNIEIVKEKIKDSNINLLEYINENNNLLN